MNILIVTPAFIPSEFGGVKIQSYYLAKWLVKGGHRVTVCTSNACNRSKNLDRLGFFNIDGIDVIYFRNYLTNKHFFQFFFPGIVTYLKKNLKKYDIVHIHDIRTFQNIVLYHYCKKYKIPYVITLHGSLPQMHGKIFFKKIYDSLIGYRILRNASKIVAITPTEVKQCKEIGLKQHQIAQIPNAIDINEYSKLPEKGSFNSEYSIDDEDDIILFLGRVHKIKGLNLLIKAYAELVKDRGRTKLVIAGQDHGCLKELKKLIKRLNIENNVVYTGFISGKNKLSAYVDADVYVLPSVYETFPVTVLEACACGTPVIVTDRCGIAHIIDDKVGYVVKYDKDQLRDAIFKVLSDEGLKKKFGWNGRKLVEQEFNWCKVIKRIEKAYERCL